jgi:hypothetical protein
MTYEALKKFFNVILHAQIDVSRLPADARPDALLRVHEAKGLRTAMRVLRSDLAILMVPLETMPREQLQAISDKLAKEGAPSIGMVKAWMNRKNAPVFERGYIVSDDEFYRLSALVDQLDGEEEKLVRSLLDKYEFRDRT